MIRIILITYCITFYYLHSIHAAVFNIPNGDVAALISAINSCNTNGEADVINLAVNGTYIFSSANHETFISVNGVYTSHGFTALPRIENTDWPTQQTLDLTIEGNGSTFIRSSTDFFRFIYIHTTATVIVKNLNFRGGKGRYKGGAIFSGWRSMLTIENCRFDSNSTYDNLGTFDQGGGAVMISSESNLQILNCNFINNRAEGYNVSMNGNGGGAVMCLLSNLRIEQSSFSNNFSSNLAGGVYIDGAKMDTGMIVLLSNQFINNSSLGAAGALLNYIYNSNTSTIEYCHFENNQANSGHGGALYSGASVINHSGYTGTTNSTNVNIKNSSFIGNIGLTRPGALFINENHALIVNCTFSGNLGGEFASTIFIGQNRLSCTLSNLTIADNGADTSIFGALYIASTNSSAPLVGVKNCIFSNNKPSHLGWNTFSQIDLQGNNLQFPGSEFGTSVPSLNPLLLQPALNGSTTKSMALQAGSPAIDAGSGCPSTDQRGASRVGICDIGAYEYGGVLISLDDLKKNDDIAFIYPNPSNGRFYVDLINKQDATIKLFTLEGKLIWSKNFTQSSLLEMDFSIKGIYLLIIETAEKRLCKRILIN